MRCIFCKVNSDGSKSVEHIVPESLGNTLNVLPRGVVCDACNNYFACKIEQDVLGSQYFRSLRYYEEVRTKKKRFPVADAIIAPDLPIQMFRDGHGTPHGLMDPTHLEKLLASPASSRLLVFERDGMPSKSIMSRFLAKCAVEALAQRFLPAPGGHDMVVDNRDFDPLRDHARRGTPRSWEFHERQIYDADRGRLTGEPKQTVYEYDLFFTHPENKIADGDGIHSELYFVLCIFGTEWCINIGGPEIDGYKSWLAAHDGVSPLYFAKDAPG